ncbi:hypothetical protein K3495_g10698 [Podosphaera aphanis]|nr:hypothetical protein K3495_g10698 [Podosphaera aphanis]
MEVKTGIWTLCGILIGLLTIMPSIKRYFGKRSFETVLLTGASEGMGLSVAKKLAQKGANIIIVARNIDKLEKALEQIKAAAADASQWFQMISADVSKSGQSSRIVAEASVFNNGELPDIVWCIAGSAYAGYFIDIPLSVMRQQMDVNYWSCVDMAHAILQGWLAPEKHGKGQIRHLIFTSSAVAFFPIAGYAPYAPTKAAIKSLSDTLVQEVVLYGDEVKIHTIFPGTIQSPGYEKENITKPEITRILEATDPVQSPEVAAAKAIHGLENGEYLVTIGFLGDAMRGCAWGGSTRNNWVIDTALTWITSLVWPFLIFDFDRQTKGYRRKNGPPSMHSKDL